MHIMAPYVHSLPCLCNKNKKKETAKPAIFSYLCITYDR